MMKTFSQNYLNLLQGEFKGINLTRIDDPDEFYNKQIIDSVLPLEKSSIFLQEINKSGILVDVGFGGGFPIFPLAVKLPAIKFIGLDAVKNLSDRIRILSSQLKAKNKKVKLDKEKIQQLQKQLETAQEALKERLATPVHGGDSSSQLQLEDQNLRIQKMVEEYEKRNLRPQPRTWSEASRDHTTT